MQNIIDSVRSSIDQGNFYGALITALILPDICAALEDGETSGSKYADWFDENMSYKGFLSGNDCYALRCSFLHQGIDDITHQKKQEVLEHYVFLTSGSHCNLFKDVVINGEKNSFLQLNASTFCEDICLAAESWLSKNSGNKSVQGRLSKMLQIHESGYTYKGLVKFG